MQSDVWGETSRNSCEVESVIPTRFDLAKNRFYEWDGYRSEKRGYSDMGHLTSDGNTHQFSYQLRTDECEAITMN